MSKVTGLANRTNLNVENQRVIKLPSKLAAPANQIKRMPGSSNLTGRRFGTVNTNKVWVAPNAKVEASKALKKPIVNFVQGRENVDAENCIKEVKKPLGQNNGPRASTVLRKIPKPCAGRPSILEKPIEVQQVKAGFSSQLLPANVENIDADDGSNHLLATDYINDIYEYLRSLEVEQTLKSNFLSIQREMTPKMRSVLVDWLINVHHQFRLLPETLYMGVSIMDRFFQREIVSKDKIQLVGVTAFFIASKFEEIYPPDLMDFVVICDQLYSKKEIIKMEMVMLRVLKFELGRPLPLHFLRRNSKAAHADPKIHSMAKYIMEVTLLDHECSAWKPSLLAAASLNVTLKIISNCETTWNETLAHYSKYTEQQLGPFVAKVCQVLRKIENSRFQNCKRKYAASKLQEISKSPEFLSPVIDELAANITE
jgi:hypothetical protein